MAELVSDELWNQIEPLLPPLPPRSPKGGRPRVDHRPALTGIVLGKAGAIHLERAVIDSASVRAVFGGRTPAPIRRIVRKQAVSATY